MSDNEPVDPKPQAEKDCHSSCTKQWSQYEACKERIEKAGKGGTCEPWAMDYWRCIDKCAAPKIFKQIK